MMIIYYHLSPGVAWISLGEVKFKIKVNLVASQNLV